MKKIKDFLENNPGWVFLIFATIYLVSIIRFFGLSTKDDYFNFRIMISTIATAIGTIGLVIVTYYNLKLVREQIDNSTESIEQMKEQIKQSGETIKLMEKQSVPNIQIKNEVLNIKNIKNDSGDELFFKHSFFLSNTHQASGSIRFLDLILNIEEKTINLNINSCLLNTHINTYPAKKIDGGEIYEVEINFNYKINNYQEINFFKNKEIKIIREYEIMGEKKTIEIPKDKIIINF